MRDDGTTLRQPYFNAPTTQNTSTHFSFGTVKRREGEWMHKEAWQRVYVGLRHMHRKNFIFSNPTCALRAPFVEHTFEPCFYLCRPNAGVAQPPRDTTETNLTF